MTTEMEMCPKHNWAIPCFECAIELRAENRYKAYCKWCESLSIEPASFETWMKTNS